MPIAIGQVSITSIHDGSSIEARYASNTSETVAPATGWSSTIPPSQMGYYLWRQERTAHADGSYSEWSAAVRITGAKGSDGESGPAGADGQPGQDAGAMAPSLSASLGTLALGAGTIHVNKIPYAIPPASRALVAEGRGLIVIDVQDAQSVAVHFLRLGTLSDGSSTAICWRDFDSGIEVAISSASLVIGEFEVYGGNVGMAEPVVPTNTDLYVKSRFMEILSAVTDVSEDGFKRMADALGIARVFKAIVALEVIANAIRANHLRVGGGNEQSGFLFEATNGEDNHSPVVRAMYDGKTVFQIDPATGQVAMVGKVNISEGSVAGTSSIDTPMFKTQKGTSSGSLTKTFEPDLWSAAELHAWLTATVGGAFQSASGTLDGLAINAVTKVENGRALVHQNTSSKGVTGPDGNELVYSYTVPEGVTHLAYSGSFSGDWTRFYAYKNGVVVISTDSSSISGTLEVAAGDHLEFRGTNGAWAVFGSKTCTWTTKWYTPVGTGTYFRLAGNVTRLLRKGYYGTTRSVSLTFGGSTWASVGANTRYISGSAIIGDPQHDVLALDFQQNCSGTVTIDGTAHTVSKITRSSDAIAYQLTDGTFQYVHSFGGEGSAGSVYTGHASSIAIEGQTEAILTSTILPNGVGKDIGSAAVKFLNLYLSGAVSANTGTFSGAVSCASINTGQGDFEITQSLGTTDSPTFANITIAGSEGTRTAGNRWYSGASFGGGRTLNTVYTKMGNDYRFKKAGTYTFYFGLRTLDNWGCSAILYKNGVAWGPVATITGGTVFKYFSQNLSGVNAGDVVDIRLKTNRSSWEMEVSSVRIQQNEEGPSV
ncbi:MAG: hypothetical protein VB025_02375 [Sphaerochaeta sp.]|nr:hypothetical protein [Sphaerochaeta sp.]